MDDGQAGPSAEAILAECRVQRRRAHLWIAVTGALIVALAVATAIAVAGNHYHGAIVFLVPVLVLVNLARLGQCVRALGKIKRAEQIVMQATITHAGSLREW